MTVPGILLRVGGAALLVLILFHSVTRDIRYTGLYSDDLRNRIVGARLVEDGRDPYTYKWKTGDGIRYYDPKNFDDHHTSVITVSPFFLHLLSPVAGMPFSGISRWWLVLEYLALVVMVTIALRAARDELQKWTVLAF